jgi:hypothetical protein
MKLVCAFLSLPVPSKPSNSCGEQVNSLISRSVPDYLEQRTLLKLLLVGYSGSGTSTIFKQVVSQLGNFTSKFVYVKDYQSLLSVIWSLSCFPTTDVNEVFLSLLCVVWLWSLFLSKNIQVMFQKVHRCYYANAFI